MDSGSRPTSPAAEKAEGPGPGEHRAVLREHRSTVGPTTPTRLALDSRRGGSRRRAVRRPAAGLVRRPREARGRRAVPRERHRRPGHPARAAGGGRAALRRCSAAARRSTTSTATCSRARGRPGRGRHRPARLLGQPQLGPLPHRRRAAHDGRRGDPGGLLRHQRLLVLVVAAGSTARTSSTRSAVAAAAEARRCSTSCGTTSTTRASWSRWSTRCWPRWPGSATSCAPRPTWSSSPTRSPSSMADTAGPDGGAYVAQHLDVVAAVTARVAEETGIAHAPTLVYCSRSGPPQVPWLEPDVNDHLEALGAGRRAGRGAGPGRVRLRPHGGRLRPRHRGAGHRRAAGPARPPRGHGRDRPALRRDGPRPAPRARRGRARRGRRPGQRRDDRPPVGPLPGRLLPQPACRPARSVRGGR